MKALSLHLPQDFSDRLSPMVVKELRHGLRTRTFTSLLVLFQLVMILSIGAGAAGAPVELITGLFWTLTLLALLAAMPAHGFNALAGEQKGGTLDMLALTSISAFRIVAGKWAALFGQTLLLGVSLLPYLVARYHLGGVELIREGAALILAVLGSGLASAALVAFSSQPSLILRLFLAAGVASGAMSLAVFIILLLNSTEWDGMLRDLALLQPWEKAGLTGGFVLLVPLTLVLLLAFGASRIATLSENHSTKKRLIYLVAVSVLALAGIALGFHSKEALACAFIPTLGLVLLAGLDVMTEDMPRFPSVVETLYARAGKHRWLAGRLLYPGWASGVFFYSLLVGMILLMMGMHAGRAVINFDASDIATLICVLTTLAVPVTVRVNRTNLFANTCVVMIGLMAASVLWMILGSVSGASGLHFALVVTPMTGLFGAEATYSLRSVILSLTALGGLAWLLLALILAARASRQYTALESQLSPAPPATPAPTEEEAEPA